jgi:hypothetical protein
LPIPIHALADAAVQWEGLGVVRQQQLRNAANLAAAGGINGGGNGNNNSSAPNKHQHHLSVLNTSTGAVSQLRHSSSVAGGMTSTTSGGGSSSGVAGGMGAGGGSSGGAGGVAAQGLAAINPKLEELWIMHDYVSSSFHTRAHPDLDLASEVKRVREEIELPIAQLHLDNPAFGPLVLPGPTVAPTCASPASPTSSSSSSSSSATSPSSAATASYSYPNGWPKMDDAHTSEEQTSKVVHARVREIRSRCLNFEKQVCVSQCYLFPPP